MARRKVKLAFIEKKSERKITYKKRQKGFMKKAQELTTLCGVEMASVMYDPFFKDVIHVFPNPEEALKTFKKFRDLSPETQSKNMMTTDEFIKKRIEKLKEQLRKLRKENNVKEITNLMYEVLQGKMVTIDTNPDDVNDLLFVMRQNHKQILELMKIKDHGEDSTLMASQSVSGPMMLDRTSLKGSRAPLLAPIGGPISMVPPTSSSLVSGRTNFVGTRTPLLVPDVSPMWEVPTMAPPTISPSAPISRLQQLFHLANTSRTSPQITPPLDPSWIPPFSSFYSQMSSPMAPPIFSSSTSQQMDVRSTSVIATPTSVSSSISSHMASSSMYAPVFPPAAPQIDTSMNIPSMGVPSSMDASDLPQNPPLPKSIDWNDDIITALFDDSYLNNMNAQDPNHDKYF